MRFNTSLIVLGLAATISAVPIGTSVTGSQTQSNATEGLGAVNGSQPTNLNSRAFGVGSGAADIERRDPYKVEVTFKQEGGLNPTDDTEKQAEAMVTATLKKAAAKLRMGSDLDITFTNHWPSAYLEKVDFTFQDPICGSGGTGTCVGESKPGGKGTIKGGAKKRKDAKVLWTEA